MDVPNSNNAVRRLLTEPLLLKVGNGRYVRGEDGHYCIDPESEKLRLAITQNSRMGAFGSWDLKKTPHDIELMRARHMWMGYTDQAATQSLLRRTIRDMHKVSQNSRIHTMAVYRNPIFASNLCMEIWPYGKETYRCTWGMTKTEVKFWEYFDKRMEKWNAEWNKRLSDAYDWIVIPLPIDPRFDRFAQAYPFFNKETRHMFHNSQGTDRKY
jgi:hypothetical protein